MMGKRAPPTFCLRLTVWEDFAEKIRTLAPSRARPHGALGPVNGNGPLIEISGPFVDLLNYRGSVREADQSSKRGSLLRQPFGL